MNYSELKLNRNIESTAIEFNGYTINVLKYLPIADKEDLCEIAVQKAKTDYGYDPLLLDVYFYLNIVYLYTDLEFSEEEKKDELKLYDEIKCSGLLTSIVEAMNAEEYDTICETFEHIVEHCSDYARSFTAGIKSTFDSLNLNMDKMQEIVSGFNPEQYQAVVDFAKAANGGRDLPR